MTTARQTAVTGFWPKMAAGLIAVAALAGLTAGVLRAQPAPVAGPAGLWIDHTGRGAVEIAPCGNKLCGRIVWMQQPNDPKGQPLRDSLNPNRSLKARAVCGIQVIGDLVRQSDGSWDDGWIYDPEQGEKFDLEIKLKGPDQLQVVGYKGLKFLNETYQWKRAKTPLQPLCPAT